MECTCCRCGKKFEYEEYYGICPKCAAYNRTPGSVQSNYDVNKAYTAVYDRSESTHAKLHERFDSAPAHQPERQHAQYHRQYDHTPIHQLGDKKQRAQKRERGKKSYIARVLVVLSVFLFVLMVVYIINADKIHQYLQEHDKTEFTVIQGELGVPVGNYQSTVRVDYAMLLADHAIIEAIPENEQMVAVHYTITDENGDYDKKIYDPPLIYCNGVYRDALYYRDIEDYMKAYDFGISADELLNRYSDMCYTGEGYYCYLIPKGEDTVSIVVREFENADSEIAVKHYVIEAELLPMPAGVSVERGGEADER